jgi:hypothetical protein
MIYKHKNINSLIILSKFQSMTILNFSRKKKVSSLLLCENE